LKILIFGGTRFIGKFLVKKLIAERHELTLFTRGIQPVPNNVIHVLGDRKNTDDLKQLSTDTFDVIIDTSGRTLEDTKKVLEIVGLPKFRFLYISSAGIYNKSNIFPIKENSSIDINSRHIGKHHTEQWILKQKIPFTSFRPTYIYGPGNYNPIERWFFDRIINKKIVPIPGDGSTITQLGHVQDLVNAMTLSLNNRQSENKIYNCSGKQGVTFLGLLEQCSIACGFDPLEVKYIFFDSTKIDSKARKLFPLRLEHFFTDISLLQDDLDWEPFFNLENGLVDSYKNDYLSNPSKLIDFSYDLKLIEQSSN
tara:strand:+ start:99 stop:1028 length:930 start_codon:yes stop_codon:yes gene_type:complete